MCVCMIVSTCVCVCVCRYYTSNWIFLSPSLSFFIHSISVLVQLLIHFYILGNILKNAIVRKEVNEIQTLKAI